MSKNSEKRCGAKVKKLLVWKPIPCRSKTEAWLSRKQFFVARTNRQEVRIGFVNLSVLAPVESLKKFFFSIDKISVS